MTDAPDDRLLTQEEAAQILGLKNPRTLAAWRLRRRGPAWIAVGRLPRYRRSDIEAFIASRRVVPGQDAS